MNLIGLKEMMNMAGRIKAKNQIVTSAHTPKNTKDLHSIQPKSEPRTISWVSNKNTSQSLYNPNTLTTSPTHNNKDPATHPYLNRINTDNHNPRMRRLTPAEAQKRREQGCAIDAEKWHIGHQCKQKELHVLLVSKGDEGVSRDEEFDQRWRKKWRS